MGESVAVEDTDILMVSHSVMASLDAISNELELCGEIIRLEGATSQERRQQTVEYLILFYRTYCQQVKKLQFTVTNKTFSPPVSDKDGIQNEKHNRSGASTDCYVKAGNKTVSSETENQEPASVNVHGVSFMEGNEDKVTLGQLTSQGTEESDTLQHGSTNPVDVMVEVTVKQEPLDTLNEVVAPDNHFSPDDEDTVSNYSNDLRDDLIDSDKEMEPPVKKLKTTKVKGPRPKLKKEKLKSSKKANKSNVGKKKGRPRKTPNSKVVSPVIEEKTIVTKEEVAIDDAENYTSVTEVTSDSRLQDLFFRVRGSKPTVYKCRVCGKEFTAKKDHVVNHVRTHTGVRPYICHICSKTFGRPGHLSRHTKSLHCGIKEVKKKNHLCDVCPASFSSSPDLREHKYLHTGEKPQVCSDCGFTTRRRENLRLHRQRKHSDVRQRKWQCQTCSRAYMTREGLREHVASHHSGNQHICEVCGKNFTSQRGLKEHLIVHQAKIYKCSVCSFSTNRIKNLRTHEKNHVLKAFQCETCGKHLGSHPALMNHHRVMHGPKSEEKKEYVCKICGATYDNKQSINSHMRKHKEKRAEPGAGSEEVIDIRKPVAKRTNSEVIIHSSLDSSAEICAFLPLHYERMQDDTEPELPLQSSQCESGEEADKGEKLPLHLNHTDEELNITSDLNVTSVTL